MSLFVEHADDVRGSTAVSTTSRARSMSGGSGGPGGAGASARGDVARIPPRTARWHGIHLAEPQAITQWRSPSATPRGWGRRARRSIAAESRQTALATILATWDSWQMFSHMARSTISAPSTQSRAGDAATDRSPAGDPLLLALNNHALVR
jgi:hypothetical protein